MCPRDTDVPGCHYLTLPYPPLCNSQSTSTLFHSPSFSSNYVFMAAAISLNLLVIPGHPEGHRPDCRVSTLKWCCSSGCRPLSPHPLLFAAVHAQNLYAYLLNYGSTVRVVVSVGELPLLTSCIWSSDLLKCLWKILRAACLSRVPFLIKVIVFFLFWPRGLAWTILGDSRPLNSWTPGLLELQYPGCVDSSNTGGGFNRTVLWSCRGAHRQPHQWRPLINSVYFSTVYQLWRPVLSSIYSPLYVGMIKPVLVR
jgi:hypothetical protein